MAENKRRGLRIAVQGCAHGDLDKIYETLAFIEQRDGEKIDLLLCCGDFQAVRNLDDLECMACPAKYRHLGTFYKYYSGEKVAPYPTLFIGGNHEASNHLWELYPGGWVAPNIYFLGYAGVVRFGGIRIAGMSGIYKSDHFTWGHFERPPYNDSTMRSAYHIRALEVNRLMRLRQPLDVFLSHDWPTGIARHGDVNALLQRKRFLQREVEDGSLGSPPLAQLLSTLRPAHWFSAHLHTKFAALVRHPGGGETRFLALDKCLPRRQFLQVIHFPDAEGPLEFAYDAEWLAVLQKTHALTCLAQRTPVLPRPEPVANEQLGQARAALERAGGGGKVPENFQVTAPAHSGPEILRGRMPRESLRNPQTVAFYEMLGLPYNLENSWTAGAALPPPAAAEPNPEEIDLGVDDFDDTDAPESTAYAGELNPEEIELEDEEAVPPATIDPALQAVLQSPS